MGPISQDLLNTYSHSGSLYYTNYGRLMKYIPSLLRRAPVTTSIASILSVKKERYFAGGGERKFYNEGITIDTMVPP